MNGQLPNLDMINTIDEITRGLAPVKLTLHDELVPFTENLTKNYINSLKRMLYMMKYQAAGTPTGNHGLYLKYVDSQLGMLQTGESMPIPNLS